MQQIITPLGKNTKWVVVWNKPDEDSSVGFKKKKKIVRIFFLLHSYIF